MINELISAGSSVFLQTTTGQLDARVVESNELGILVALDLRNRDDSTVEKQRFFPWTQILFIQAASS